MTISDQDFWRLAEETGPARKAAGEVLFDIKRTVDSWLGHNNCCVPDIADGQTPEDAVRAQLLTALLRIEEKVQQYMLEWER